MIRPSFALDVDVLRELMPLDVGALVLGVEFDTPDAELLPLVELKLSGGAVVGCFGRGD